MNTNIEQVANAVELLNAGWALTLQDDLWALSSDSNDVEISGWVARQLTQSGAVRLIGENAGCSVYSGI